MSLLTTVTIVTDDSRAPECLRHVQTFEWGDSGMTRLAYFGKLDTENAGGTKVYCSDIYAACFNYLPIGPFLEHLAAVPWNPYSNTVVIIDNEQEDDPIIWRPSDDRAGKGSAA